MDDPPFVKQCHEISFNLFLDIIDLTTKIPEPICQSTYKFAAIRESWNLVMNNGQKSYFPHADVTVD